VPVYKLVQSSSDFTTGLGAAAFAAGFGAGAFASTFLGAGVGAGAGAALPSAALSKSPNLLIGFPPL
jgi:hypothetical protein